VLRETGDLLLWRAAPMSFHDEFGWVPAAGAIIGVATLLAIAYALFRPLAAPRSLPYAAGAAPGGRSRAPTW
jgi:hypothetical protein